MEQGICPKHGIQLEEKPGWEISYLRAIYPAVDQYKVQYLPCPECASEDAKKIQQKVLVAKRLLGLST